MGREVLMFLKILDLICLTLLCLRVGSLIYLCSAPLPCCARFSRFCYCILIFEIRQLRYNCISQLPSSGPIRNNPEQSGPI